MEGKSIKGTENPAASGLDPADDAQVRSLDLAIPVIKQSVSLLRRLRERADAARHLAAADHEKPSAVGGVGGCIQKGALEISAKAAPGYTPRSLNAEPRQTEASSGESRAPNSRTEPETASHRVHGAGPSAACRTRGPSGDPSETKPR
jgi:hypothetical protein